MRIIVTADLHYDIRRSVQPVERLADRIARQHAEALIIAGDACGHELGILRRCFDLFDRFPGQVLYVAGNHDLWTHDGDSLHRYESEIADVCRDAGVWYLDREPWLRGDVAVVGSVGWYDYSFRRRDLDIPMRFYEHKLAPGAAAHLAEYAHLIDGHDDIPPPALGITTRWMDGQHVHLPMSDVEFTGHLRDRLAAHLDHVAPRARHIVVAMHHIPFAAAVRYTGKPGWDFATAFLGSQTFGDLLIRYPNIRHVIAGHTHRPDRQAIATVDYINIGSTYRAKRYETLTLL
jgi:predicted phosphodiesterase